MYSINYQKNNRVNIYKDGSFDIVTQSASFYKCRPSIDSEDYGFVKISNKGSSNKISVTYIFEGHNLRVDFSGDKSGLLISSQINIKNTESILSVNLFSGAYLIAYDKILSHGYFSWDQSIYRLKEELTA